MKHSVGAQQGGGGGGLCNLAISLSYVTFFSEGFGLNRAQIIRDLHICLSRGQTERVQLPALTEVCD